MLVINANKQKNQGATAPKGTYLFSTPAMMFQEIFRKIFLYNAIASQGTYTLSIQPTNGQTTVVGGKTYTWQTTLTDVDGNIKIGASLAASQQNLIDAINLTGTVGTQYAASMSENPQVSAATSWTTNTLVVTAKTAGTAGNSIATGGTAGSWDAATLGTTRAGVGETETDTGLWSSNWSNQSGYASVADVNDATWTNFDDYNQQGQGGWKNSDFAFTSDLIAAGASRKVVLPDHFGRAIRRLRKISPRIYTQKRTRAVLGAPFTAHGSNQIIKAIPLDTSRVAWMYNQHGGTTGMYLVIASVDANGLQTFGTPVLIDDNTDVELVDMCMVSTDKLFFVFPGTTSFATGRVATISGTTITMNAVVQIAATAIAGSATCETVGTDKAVVAWGNGTQVTYNVVSIAGTVPSYGANFNITGSPTWTKLIANGTDKLQAFYLKAAGPTTIVVSVSGTSVSFGGELNIMGGALMNSKYTHAALQIATDKFIWMGSTYDENVNFDRRNTALINVSSLTSSVGGTALSSMNGHDTMRIFRASGNDYYYIGHNSTAMAGKKFTVDTTANTITFQSGNPVGEWARRGTDWHTSGRWFSNWHSYHDNYGFGGQNVIVQVGTKHIMMGLGVASQFEYVSTDNISLQILHKESVVATINTTYGFLVEPISVNYTLPETTNEFHYKIRNNSASPIYLWQARTWIELE